MWRPKKPSEAEMVRSFNYAETMSQGYYDVEGLAYGGEGGMVEKVKAVVSTRRFKVVALLAVVGTVAAAVAVLGLQSEAVVNAETEPVKTCSIPPLQALSQCQEELYYPDFACEAEVGNITELDFLRQANTATGAGFHGKRLGFTDTAFNNTIHDEYYSPLTDNGVLVGAYMYNIHYSIEAETGYVYVETGHHYTAVPDIGLTTVYDASEAGEYFCFMVKLNKAPQRLLVQFESNLKSGSEVFADVNTTEWENVCVDTTELTQALTKPEGPYEPANLTRVTVIHRNYAAEALEDMHMEIGMFYFSSIITAFERPPAIVDPADRTVMGDTNCIAPTAEALNLPGDCLNYFSEFFEEIHLESPYEIDLTEARLLQTVDGDIAESPETTVSVDDSQWAFLRITDYSPPALDRPNIAFIESTAGMHPDQVTSQKLNYFTDEEDNVTAAGNYIMDVEYSLDSTQVLYMVNTFRWLDLYGEGVPVNVTGFGDYFCFWLKSSAIGETLTLSFASGKTEVSYIDYVLDTTEWHNRCLPLWLLKTLPGLTPVDLTRLQRVAVEHSGVKNAETMGEGLYNYTMKYTMLYFSQFDRVYPVFQALYKPEIILNSEPVDGKCEYLTGPTEMNVPPVDTPPATPVSYYTRDDYGGAYDPSNRLAVLLVDTDSDWYGMAEGLKTIGVPFTLTESLTDALNHGVILVYPAVTDATFTAPEEAQLVAFMEAGNVLILPNLEDTDLMATCKVSIRDYYADFYSFLVFETDDPNTPVSKFTCRLGDEEYTPYYHYQCPTGVDDRGDVEKYMKLWFGYNGAAYGGGYGVKSYELQSDATALATYIKRIPVLDGGEHVFIDGKVQYTEEAQPDRAALIQASVGTQGGLCYTMGIDIGNFIMRARTFQMEGVSRAYSSLYEPGSDLILRFIKNAYSSVKPSPSLHTVPNGKQVAIMISHDCDSNRPELWKLYGEREVEMGVKATFLIYTKQIKDGYDVPFFYRGWEDLIGVAKLGHELGSHSTAHSPNFGKKEYEDYRFADFPLGTGTEQYHYGDDVGYKPKIFCNNYTATGVCDEPQYQFVAPPICNYYKAQTGDDSEFQCGVYRTTGGTILGDLRVSKFLVEKIYEAAGFPEKKVRAFRPGHLRYPDKLNEALVAAGYNVASIYESLEANTQLYFRQTFHYRVDARDVSTRSGVDLWEFPILFDDMSAGAMRPSWRSEALGPNTILPDHGVDYANHTTTTASRIGKFGGILVALVHPTEEAISPDGEEYTGEDKIEWAMELVDRTRDFATVVTLSEMQDFVKARYYMDLDYRDEVNGQHTLLLQLPLAIDGLTIEVPTVWGCSLPLANVVSIKPDPVYPNVQHMLLSSLSAGSYSITC